MSPGIRVRLDYTTWQLYRLYKAQVRNGIGRCSGSMPAVFMLALASSTGDAQLFVSIDPDAAWTSALI